MNDRLKPLLHRPSSCPPCTLELLEGEERGSTSHPATSGWPCPNSSEQRGHRLELNSRRRQSSSRGKFENGWDRKTTVFLRRTRELLAIVSATSNFISFVQAHWKQSHCDTLDRCARGLLFLCYFILTGKVKAPLLGKVPRTPLPWLVQLWQDPCKPASTLPCTRVYPFCLSCTRVQDT